MGLQGIADRPRVVGDPALDGTGHVEGEGDGEGDDQCTGHATDHALPSLQSAHAVGEFVAGERDDQQGNRDPCGEGNGEQHGLGSDGAGRSRHRDGRENRTRARHEHRTQGQSEDEAAQGTGALRGDLALWDPGEEPFEELFERGKDHRQPDKHEGAETEPPQ